MRVVPVVVPVLHCVGRLCRPLDVTEGAPHRSRARSPEIMRLVTGRNAIRLGAFLKAFRMLPMPGTAFQSGAAGPELTSVARVVPGETPDRKDC